MTYMLRLSRLIALPPGHQPTPDRVADWLERALPFEDAEVNRIDERTLEFRPDVMTSGFRWNYEASLRLIARGEVEVQTTPQGPRLAVAFQPRLWLAVIPIVQVAIVLGVGDATAMIRWGAGLGGIVLSGVLLGLAWLNAVGVFGRIADEIQSSYTAIPPKQVGAA